METITQWSATSWGVAGLTVGYAYLLARAWLTDKRKANQDHVNSVEGMQRMLREDIVQMRLDFKALQDKFDALQTRHEACTAKLSASLTRLELLEDYRRIVKEDNPTGLTKTAMPPPPEHD